MRSAGVCGTDGKDISLIPTLLYDDQRMKVETSTTQVKLDDI